MDKLDRRFATSDPEERCNQCGHAQNRHYNIHFSGCCAYDGCDCFYNLRFAAAKALFNLVRQFFRSIGERVVRPFQKPPEL
jgi:hypothetical protein